MDVAWGVRRSCIRQLSATASRMARSWTVERDTGSLKLVEPTVAVLGRSAECRFGAGTFDAVLPLLLPVAGTLCEKWLASCSLLAPFRLRYSSAGNVLDSRSHGSGNSNGVWIIASTAFNTVAGGKEGVESLY